MEELLGRHVDRLGGAVLHRHLPGGGGVNVWGLKHVNVFGRGTLRVYGGVKVCIGNWCGEGMTCQRRDFVLYNCQSVKS